MPWQNEGGPILLYKGVNKSVDGGSGAPTIEVDSYTIPGGLMSPTGAIHLRVWYDQNVGSALRVVRWEANDLYNAAGTASDMLRFNTFIVNQDSLSAQKSVPIADIPENVTKADSFDSYTENTANDTTIYVMGAPGAGETIIVPLWLVEYYP